MPTLVDREKLLAQIVQFFRKALEHDSEGQKLAAALGLHDAALLERYKVGYAGEAMLRAIPSSGGLRQALIDLGVLDSEGRLIVAGSLVVPASDREGHVRGMVFITADSKERILPSDAALHGVNLQSLRSRRAVVTDSSLTALRYLQVGTANVTLLNPAAAPAEEVFLKAGRPKAAYCDVREQKLVRMLQGLEIPCLKLTIAWPADASAVSRALTTAEPIEVEVGDEATAKVVDGLVHFDCGGREYRVRDLDPGDAERMRVHIRAVDGERFHLDTIDLYSARPRVKFAKAAAGLLGAAVPEVEADFRVMIAKLDAIREAERLRRLRQDEGYQMTADEEAEALEYLQQPDLLKRVVRDMETLGYVGEELNKKLGFLIAISRKMSSPLSGVIISRAGAGKSRLMEVLADMTPPEQLVAYTRITPQALYYGENGYFRHKLMIAGEEEGIAGSDYPLREMISSKSLRLVTPGRDAETGKFRVEHYEVKGPVALLFSTTKPSIHFENATRCFRISLNESPEQTQGIHDAQRRSRTAASLDGRASSDELRILHRNVQRMLREVAVVNPFAPHLTFPTKPLEMRRENEKYLSLIDAVALLHQHQRKRATAVVGGREVEYVEASVEDVAEANRLMTDILGQNRDELSAPSRKLLGEIRRMVEDRAREKEIAPGAVRFLRRDIRDHTGWSDSQIKAHIGQLEDLEYLVRCPGGGGKRYRYELDYEDAVLGRKKLPGLTDPKKLKAMVAKSGSVGNGLAQPAKKNLPQTEAQSAVKSESRPKSKNEKYPRKTVGGE